MLVPVWSRVALQRLAEESPLRYIPIWSEWIVAETWRVLTRKRVETSQRTGQAVDWRTVERSADRMMAQLLRVMAVAPLGRRTDLPPAWPGHPDPNDVPIWQTAKIAGAQFVVSHDLASFPPAVARRHVYDGVEYLTAIEFIEQVLKADAANVLGSRPPAAGLLRSGRPT